MHLWHDIDIGPGAPRVVDAVIEIPTGGRVKYEIDKTYGIMRATRIVYGAVHYPANYGFIPRTLGDDGDALDILVLGQEALLPGSLVTARVIGVMPMVDTGDADEKIIAVHVGDPAVDSYKSLESLPPHRMNEIMRFFGDYKALEGKEVKVAAPLGVDAAVEVIRAAQAMYQKKFENRIAT